MVVKAQETIPMLTHNYVSGKCSNCGITDPNYIPEFKAGETWKVDGQWEMSFEDAKFVKESSGKQIVLITWKYKNIGYNGELKVSYSKLKVFDSAMEIADNISTTGSNNYMGVGCPVGTQATCSDGWKLNNASNSIKVYIVLKDSNNQTHKAYFVLNVAQESESDKLEGCTINVDNTLPIKLNYYKNNSIQSSCSVTEVSFEVSGDDLYIYFSGNKTYDSRGSNQSDSCKIGWKLYDNNNNVIASGTAYTLSIATGEGFVKTKDTAYNCITAGGTYKLVLLNVN